MSITYGCDACGCVSTEMGLTRRGYGPMEKYSGYPYFSGDVCDTCRKRIEDAAREAERAEIVRIKGEAREGGNADD